MINPSAHHSHRDFFVMISSLRQHPSMRRLTVANPTAHRFPVRQSIPFGRCVHARGGFQLPASSFQLPATSFPQQGAVQTAERDEASARPVVAIAQARSALVMWT
jgi:hypothetical protein